MKGIYGAIVAVGAIAVMFVLAAIFLPIDTEWKLFCGLFGISIILFMASAAAWMAHWIMGIIIGVLALGTFGFAIYFFLEAANISLASG